MYEALINFDQATNIYSALIGIVWAEQGTLDRGTCALRIASVAVRLQTASNLPPLAIGPITTSPQNGEALCGIALWRLLDLARTDRPQGEL